MNSEQPKLAVIGAGISGLTCAQQLRDAGWKVKVFEKSRGVGGRMSTRRAEQGLQFDHGAQYFTVRDAEFERYVHEWAASGIVAAWDCRIVDLTNGQASPKQKATPRFVGVPGMNSICKHLATGLDVQFQTRVSPPSRERDVWRLQNEQSEPLGEFDCVITSAPAPQSSELLAAAPDLQGRVQATTMNGCWAAMIAFEEPLGLAFDGAFVHESLLSWISRNDSKPQRGSGINEQDGAHECWVLHASPEWTSQHIEEDPEAILPIIIDAFWHSTGATQRMPVFATAHRWRYAIPPEPLKERCVFDPQLRIGACGDWCNGPRVEGAFLSGLAMAERVLARTAATEQ